MRVLWVLLGLIFIFGVVVNAKNEARKSTFSVRFILAGLELSSDQRVRISLSPVDSKEAEVVSEVNFKQLSEVFFVSVGEVELKLELFLNSSSIHVPFTVSLLGSTPNSTNPTPPSEQVVTRLDLEAGGKGEGEGEETVNTIILMVTQSQKDVVETSPHPNTPIELLLLILNDSISNQNNTQNTSLQQLKLRAVNLVVSSPPLLLGFTPLSSSFDLSTSFPPTTTIDTPTPTPTLGELNKSFKFGVLSDFYGLSPGDYNVTVYSMGASSDSGASDAQILFSATATFVLNQTIFLIGQYQLLSFPPPASNATGTETGEGEVDASTWQWVPPLSPVTPTPTGTTPSDATDSQDFIIPQNITTGGWIGIIILSSLSAMFVVLFLKDQICVRILDV